MFYLAIVTVLLALAAPARAESVRELPQGHYQLHPGGPEFCLDVLPERHLRLTFQDSSDRMPVVIDGSYDVRAAKMGDYSLRYTISGIHQKTLSRCRKYWIDAELPSTTRLDTLMRPSGVLTLGAKFECADSHPAVQLCLHDAGTDGKQVICRTLFDFEHTCKEPPAIDGARINAPDSRTR